MEENILRKEKEKKKIQKKRYLRRSAFTTGNQIIVECGAAKYSLGCPKFEKSSSYGSGRSFRL